MPIDSHKHRNQNRLVDFAAFSKVDDQPQSLACKMTGDCKTDVTRNGPFLVSAGGELIPHLPLAHSQSYAHRNRLVRAVKGSFEQQCGVIQIERAGPKQR